MSKESRSTTLSCTIPSKLGEQLNLIAQLEERSKSYYVKKALQSFLSDRLENAILSHLGQEAYHAYVSSGKEEIPYDIIRKELNLD